MIRKWTNNSVVVHQSSKFDGQARNCFCAENPGNTHSPLNVDLGGAPEKRQPFGNRSKESLSGLVFGKEVDVEWNNRDRYQRIVGKVLVADPNCQSSHCPKTFDAGLAQISSGLAWWYRKYANAQSSADARRYESAEQDARTRQAGLWVENQPIPPWDWRKAKR